MEDFNEGMDGKLASRMRKVHPEQFHTLVKMHLSFELHINTEENDVITEKGKQKKWGLLPFSKKPKPPLNIQKCTENASLTKDGINQIKQLIKFLSKKESIEQEGIFRRTGKLTRQQDLKTAIYQGLPLDLDSGKFSVHDCASVLKGYLADLSEPLLTEIHFPEYCQIAELYTSGDSNNDSRLLSALQLLLLLLPPPNRIVLKHILNLLNKTASHEENNKMNCDTLATLFIPHLMCPRKLSPEALHVNSQNLSGLVAFMIRNAEKLFEIPHKLSTDIRAFWVEHEKKLLSPQKSTLNESTTDGIGAAHTVFSFVDHNLTAKATAMQDTQAALAQLYAHIQSMPDSSQKRRFVKKFNKENGQGTPLSIKHNASSIVGGNNGSGCSFGDSIKKRIFHKKIHKKIIDVKLGCNFSRSSSEENIVTNILENSTLLPKVFSKSEDELSDLESCDLLNQEQKQSDNNNLLKSRSISNSAGSLDTPIDYKSKVILKSYLNISENSQERVNTPTNVVVKTNEKSIQDVSTKNEDKESLTSSLHDTCDKFDDDDEESAVVNERQISAEVKTKVTSSTNNVEGGIQKKNIAETESPEKRSTDSIASDNQSSSEVAALLLSPSTKNRLRCLYAAHTSTPSNLLGKSLITVNDYGLTPTDDERSMSPITQSATKMTKAMQMTMMTPRSRKPVMVSASTTNLCNLATLNNDSVQYDSNNSLQSNFDVPVQPNYVSNLAVSPVIESLKITDATANKENVEKSVQDTPEGQQTFVTCIEYDPDSTTKGTTTVSTNTKCCKEYYLSRSVLSASPVDLSFTSRTGDFEQSGSDLNVIPEEENTQGSDTLDMVMENNNSSRGDKLEKASSPRKRCTSLDRDDWKRPMEEDLQTNIWNLAPIDKSALKSIKDSLSETSF